MKKFAALSLVLILTLAMCVPASSSHFSEFLRKYHLKNPLQTVKMESRCIFDILRRSLYV